MARQDRPDPHCVDDVFEQPWAWDFFQAMRQIECVYRDHPPLGTSRTLREDPVRFGQFISLAFAASSLEQAPKPAVTPDSWSDDPLPPEPAFRKLLVRFTGLTGPNGPMPLVFSEMVRNRQAGIDDPDLPRAAFGEDADLPLASRRDPALAEFLDIFHHRLITLFYRAWAMAQKAVDFDRVALPADGFEDEDERSSARETHYFSEWIASTFGEGLPDYDGLDSIPTWQKLAFAGLLSDPTRHLEGLGKVLAAAFATGSQVTPLVGQWLEIPARECCRLGETPRTGALGRTAVVGSRVWDRQQKITLQLGPVSFAEFQSYLPGGLCHRQLHDWVAYYTRREVRWEADILLRRDEVPKTRLDSISKPLRGGGLGRTNWLSSRPFQHDPRDYQVRGGGFTPHENS
jgi:type VI secretion system protein ImpH